MKKNVNKKLDDDMKVRNKRRLRYGGLSVLLTVAVIALVIVFNVIASSLASSMWLYTDLTGSQLYTISENALSYLSYVKSPITIKFAVPLDTISSNASLYMVYNAASQFAKATTDDDPEDKIPDITVEYFDAYRYPSTFEKYKELSTSDWSDTNVVVETTGWTGEEEEGGSVPRVITLDTFFHVDSNTGALDGFKGESIFITAFIDLAGMDRPVAAFTTGHGEPIGTSISDPNNEYSAFFRLLTDYGFEVQWIDLQKEELDPDTRLVIICDPQRDFVAKDLSSVGVRSEIDKIAEFVNDQGSLMAFVGPTGSEFPVLADYLAEWGIAIHTTATIEDTENALTSNTQFSVKYTTDGLGASMQEKYRTQRTIFSQAAPVEILWTDKESESAMNITSSFRTSASAKAYINGDEKYYVPSDLGAKQGEGFDLFVVSGNKRYEAGQYARYSFVMGCGSPEMLKYCSSQSYANRGILSVLVTNLPLSNTQAMIDIDYKGLEVYGFAGVTSSATRTWTIVLAVALPAVVMAAGTAVVISRKRK